MISVVVLISATVYFFSLQKQRQQQELTFEDQAGNNWEMFSGITRERRYIEEANAYYRFPIFSQELKAKAGKEITISGYYLPYSKVDSVIIISRFPIASCFFCGKAGLESVAMVELEKAAKSSYRTDQILTVTGKLTLNSSDIKKLAFVIANASVRKHQ